MTDVEFLRGLKFKWNKIAEILGVSRSTLYRRLSEEGIPDELQYSSITDRQLDTIILRIKESHPHDGEVMMLGHLQREGMRWRLRASIHRVDPINTALQKSRTVRRRVYSVSGPNVVWHVDGNHKLIHWRFVIHDGYSRLITFLNCTTLLPQFCCIFKMEWMSMDCHRKFAQILAVRILKYGVLWLNNIIHLNAFLWVLQFIMNALSDYGVMYLDVY